MSSGPSAENASPLAATALATLSLSANQRRSQYTVSPSKFLAVEQIENYFISITVRHLGVSLDSQTRHCGWTL
jgi:hypothetical protein